MSTVEVFRKAFRESRRGWMEAARIYASLWPSKLTKQRIEECVEKARVNSRLSWQFGGTYDVR